MTRKESRYSSQGHGDDPDLYRSTGSRSDPNFQHRGRSTKPKNVGGRQPEPRQQSATKSRSFRLDDGYPKRPSMDELTRWLDDCLARGLKHHFVIRYLVIDLALRLLAKKESRWALAEMSLDLAKKWDPKHDFYPYRSDDIETMEEWIEFFFGHLESGDPRVKVHFSSSEAAAASFQPTFTQPARSYPDRVTEMLNWCPSHATLVVSNSVSTPPHKQSLWRLLYVTPLTRLFVQDGRLHRRCRQGQKGSLL